MEFLFECPSCSATAINTYIKVPAQMHSDKELFNFDQCGNCSLVFLNPRVPEEQLKNYYTEYYLPYRGAKAWGKYASLVEKSQQKMDLKRMQLIQQVYPVKTDSLILDIGCGQPSFLATCFEHINCKAMGIDFSDSGWAGDEEKYAGIDLRIAEVNGLSDELNPDVITMWHYLEHDYSPLSHLKKLRSIAKNDTALVIEVPNIDSESRKKYEENWAGWHTPRHTSLFSSDTITLLLKNSGWKVTQLNTYGTMDAYQLYWMSEMIQKGIEWNKNMEEELTNFVLGMLKFLPKRWREKKSSLGIMTVVAHPYEDYKVSLSMPSLQVPSDLYG